MLLFGFNTSIASRPMASTLAHLCDRAIRLLKKHKPRLEATRLFRSCPKIILKMFGQPLSLFLELSNFRNHFRDLSYRSFHLKGKSWQRGNVIGGSSCSRYTGIDGWGRWSCRVYM